MWSEKGYKKSFRWPEGVRLPIAISVHHQSEEATCPMPDGQPDPFDYSERQYGARRGAWRLLDILARHGVRGTWLICGATLEKYPQVSRAVQQAGHCIAGHTYAHEMMCNMPPDTEVALIKKTVTVFEDLLGERIRGWRTCFASHNTLDLLLEHSAIEWDGSMWNDDLPSLIAGHGREILEIPFATYSDTALGVDITNPAFPPTRFSTWNANPPDFMLRGFKSAFDALYERGAERAVMMPLVVHDFITGRPFRSKVLDEFLAYAKQFDGVVFTGHDELARWARASGEFGNE